MVGEEQKQKAPTLGTVGEEREGSAPDEENVQFQTLVSKFSNSSPTSQPKLMPPARSSSINKLLQDYMSNANKVEKIESCERIEQVPSVNRLKNKFGN